MKQAVVQPIHELDAQGYLVRLPDETDADYAVRTATVLHQSGMSPNSPADVEAQYDAEEPPIVMEDGEETQAFEERKRAAHEEWVQGNQKLREEAFAKEKQAAEEREKARLELRKEQGFDDETRRVEEEAHATERSKRAAEDSVRRGPQPSKSPQPIYDPQPIDPMRR
jgi:hypothetical protein